MEIPLIHNLLDNNYILGGMETNLKGISTHTFFWVLTKQ
jgi:hypothetical protein